MATYMVSGQFSGDTRNAAIEPFMEGSKMQPPEGVENLARWHSVEGDASWGVVRTDDPKHLADWLLHWTDVISYHVTPVISDEELGELFKKHFEGPRGGQPCVSRVPLAKGPPSR